MLASELEHLLRVVPPGTQVEILRITVPAAAATSAGITEAITTSPAWTPESIVEWVRRTHGEDGCKLKEWAGMLPGISHRELVRAAGDGRLDCHARSSGKDHGARMASPDAMLAFLDAWPLGNAP
jgi:hypothetical protein